jgi:hypothetical protein
MIAYGRSEAWWWRRWWGISTIITTTAVIDDGSADNGTGSQSKNADCHVVVASAVVVAARFVSSRVMTPIVGSSVVWPVVWASILGSDAFAVLDVGDWSVLLGAGQRGNGNG